MPLIKKLFLNYGIGYHLRKARYYVSDTPKISFRLHPAFIVDGYEKDYIYLSAFEGTLYDVSASTYILNNARVADHNTDMLSSIANSAPTYDSIGNARKLAQNRGPGWQLSYCATVSATQMLFLIEYASFDMQEKIGVGVSGKPNNNTSKPENTGGSNSLGNKTGSTQRRQSASESEERGAQKQLLKGIQETIEKINQKLEKISAINEKVTELEVKYSTLDGSMKRIHERIDGMQSRLDALDKVT